MRFIRTPIGHDGYALVATALEETGFLAAFSERTGGVSADRLASLNLSYTAGDDPANVSENRARFIGGLGIGSFTIAKQVHGKRIIRVGTKRAGTGFDGSASIGEADGLMTAAPGVPLAVLTADCLALVLASESEGKLAIVHAGWRGVAAGILSRAAAAFERPGDVRVAIGPAIGPCHYEVGEDVALAVAAASDAGAATQRRAGRLFLDLSGTAKAVLRAAGIRRVEDTGLCTACEPDRFYSHRRDGPTGRQAAIGLRLREGS